MCVSMHVWEGGVWVCMQVHECMYVICVHISAYDVGAGKHTRVYVCTCMWVCLSACMCDCRNVCVCVGVSVFLTLH